MKHKREGPHTIVTGRAYLAAAQFFISFLLGAATKRVTWPKKQATGSTHTCAAPTHTHMRTHMRTKNQHTHAHQEPTQIHTHTHTCAHTHAGTHAHTHFQERTQVPTWMRTISFIWSWARGSKMMNSSTRFMNSGRKLARHCDCTDENISFWHYELWGSDILGQWLLFPPHFVDCDMYVHSDILS